MTHETEKIEAMAKARQEAFDEAARLICPYCAASYSLQDGNVHYLMPIDLSGASKPVFCEAAAIRRYAASTPPQEREKK